MGKLVFLTVIKLALNQYQYSHTKNKNIRPLSKGPSKNYKRIVVRQPSVVTGKSFQPAMTISQQCFIELVPPMRRDKV